MPPGIKNTLATTLLGIFIFLQKQVNLECKTQHGGVNTHANKLQHN